MSVGDEAVTLEWIRATPRDSDGASYDMHYLIDPVTKQCFATITEPRWGSLLYVTDIRVAGVDRSYITLEAAKEHCEWTAFEYERTQSEELAKAIKQVADYAEVKVNAQVS